MSKTSIRGGLIIILLAFAISLGVRAQQICNQKPIATLFFNGVNTTKLEAEQETFAVADLFGDRSPANSPIKYLGLYNYTNGIEDFVEVFDQRMIEHDLALKDRMELYWDIARGGGSTIDTIQLASPSGLFTKLIAETYPLFQAALAKALTTYLANPPTIENYTEQSKTINELLNNGYRLVFFAHSQGNLFATEAYRYLEKIGQASNARVVHVAPASVELKGNYTLVDIDIVINFLLRLTGTAPAPTTKVSKVGHGSQYTGKIDPFGHGLLEVYLNDWILPTEEEPEPPLDRISSQMYSAYQELDAKSLDCTTIKILTATCQVSPYGAVWKISGVANVSYGDAFWTPSYERYEKAGTISSFVQGYDQYGNDVSDSKIAQAWISTGRVVNDISCSNWINPPNITGFSGTCTDSPFSRINGFNYFYSTVLVPTEPFLVSETRYNIRSVLGILMADRLGVLPRHVDNSPGRASDALVGQTCSTR